MIAPNPRFGAHLSVAGGLEKACHAGASLGCDCLQVFVKNQRQWSAGPLSREHIRAFRQAREAAGITPIVAHGSYLLNLASPVPRTRSRSIKAMLDELKRCEALGIDHLVIHPGARMGDTLEAGIVRIARALDQVLSGCPAGRTMILLETTAGQGSSIGHRFEHLEAILDSAGHPDRLGVCLDTCHLFAAGYDFRDRDGYRAMIDELDRTITLPRVRCIHMNDSKRACGSRVDRHEHIGKGKIGKPGLAHFVNDLRFAGIPMILETPKGKDGRGTDLDKVNLKRLRGLVKK
ncbi:MAG: deoxyribonuclease IV [Planctomycetota bacterium]